MTASEPPPRVVMMPLRESEVAFLKALLRAFLEGRDRIADYGDFVAEDVLQALERAVP